MPNAREVLEVCVTVQDIENDLEHITDRKYVRLLRNVLKELFNVDFIPYLDNFKDLKAINDENHRVYSLFPLDYHQRENYWLL